MVKVGYAVNFIVLGDVKGTKVKKIKNENDTTKC